MQARHEEQRRPDERDQHGLTEVRLQDQRNDRHRQQQRTRGCLRRQLRRRRAALGERPGGENDERRLDELGRLQAENPAPRALDLGAEQQRQDDQRHADRKYMQQRRAPDVARRKERRRDQQQRRGQQQQRLPVDEMERRQAEPLGDRRARRERHHHADRPSARRTSRAASDRLERNQSATGPRSALEIMAAAASNCIALARTRARRGRRVRLARRARETRVAARLEIGELVVGRAGRRQQHHRLRRGAEARRRARPRRRPPRACRSARTGRRRPASRRRPRSPRRSDRPWRRAGTAARSGSMPPSLALPPAIQKMSRNEQQRLFRRVGVGRLEIVDEQHPAAPPDLLHPVRRGRGTRRARARSPRRRRRARARRRRRKPRSGRCARRASAGATARSIGGSFAPRRDDDGSSTQTSARDDAPAGNLDDARRPLRASRRAGARRSPGRARRRSRSARARRARRAAP